MITSICCELSRINKQDSIKVKLRCSSTSCALFRTAFPLRVGDPCSLNQRSHTVPLNNLNKPVINILYPRSLLCCNSNSVSTAMTKPHAGVCAQKEAGPRQRVGGVARRGHEGRRLRRCKSDTNCSGFKAVIMLIGLSGA